MNLEIPSEPKYIKIDFKNKLILKNDSDIKEETSEQKNGMNNFLNKNKKPKNLKDLNKIKLL